MPIYEFECLGGHRTEIILTIEESEQKIDRFCYIKLNKWNEIAREGDLWEYCGLLLEKVWSRFNTTQEGKSTIVYKNPATGQILNPVFPNQPIPHGFIKEEIKGQIERLKLEKTLQEKDKTEHEIYKEGLQIAKDESRKKRQEDLSSNLSRIADESTNPTAVKELTKFAMNRSKKKRLPPKKAENFFEINHMDSSNVDKG